MTDTIIKGSGNSRTLKSVPNLATLAPTYDSFLALLTGEGMPIDLGPLNEAGVQIHGTDLTKANLLKDATAALYGLTAAATPDQVLAAARPLIKAAQDAADSALSSANGRSKIVTGSYAGTMDSNSTGNKTISLGINWKVFIAAANHPGFSQNPIIGIALSGRSYIYCPLNSAVSGSIFGISVYSDGIGVPNKVFNHGAYTYNYVAIG